MTSLLSSPLGLTGLRLFLLMSMVFLPLSICGQTTRTNVALNSNGGVAAGSTYLDSGRTPSAAINGDRKGLHWGSDPATGSGWHCGTSSSYPDVLEIAFNGAKTIEEISVITLQDSYSNPAEPTEAMSFGSFGITHFEVQYWNGAAWVTIPSGSVTGNNKVWRKFIFTPVTTNKIRINVTGALASYSRIVEVEAWTIPQPAPDTNVALFTNGGQATASSNLDSGRLPAAANNGDRKGIHWGSDPSTGSGWHCATNGAYPDWLQIQFDAPKIIDQIDLFAVQDNYNSPIEPNSSMTFSLYGLSDFRVQYWTGSSWADVPGGNVTGNTLVWRKFSFAPITTTKIQVLIMSTPPGPASYSRIVELEAWTPSAPADVNAARLDPMNRTGGAGEDPLSRNFNWSTSLVNLSGRAAMDLKISLDYNSLATWLKSGSQVSFDDDRGWPSAGFRLGFPVIQSLYFNTETGKQSYVLISPDGSRTELRQVGASALYEAADSSYMLLDSLSMTLRTTGGTQLSFAWQGADYQCTKITDRNGNFISINYTSLGRIDTVVDTLGRVVKFNYDGNNLLTSITQVWSANGVPVTHYWATFNYADLAISTNFSGLTNLGPPNGAVIKVLSRVISSNNARFDFDYTSWGQVRKISNYAADGHLLSYISYNLPVTSSPPQSDCPRFTQRRDLAENWNRAGTVGTSGLPSGPEQEVVTSYAVPANSSWTLPDGTQQSGTVAQVTSPDLTYNKIYYAGIAGTSTGWQRGLPSLVETYDSTNTRQRQAVTTWNQTNANLSYPLNPRVAETNIYDPAGNRARTRVTYQTANLPDGTTCSLPQDLYEYQTNAATVLRRTHLEYNLNASYTNRRLIGLISEKTLYQVDQNTIGETLMSKTAFQFDEAGSIQGNDLPVQHDNINYTGSFLAGRGNLSSIKRYDVTNTSQFTNSRLKYNTAGAVVAIIDPLGHQSTVSYVDSFSDGNNSGPTLAYPTTVTDADGFSSLAQYNFDFGSVTRTQRPPPAGQSTGEITHFIYDAIGRTQKVATEFNGNTNFSYTRFEYPTSLNRVDTFVTIETGVEAHSYEVSDGHGRPVASVINHPGSTGGFSAQLSLFDPMGRAIKTSNPTETNASGSYLQWAATGDDASSGWLYTQKGYDWKGRPRVLTNTDGSTKEASYSGCGCAGGQVVTLTDEGTLNAGVVKRRQQKIYSDILGRTIKTEVLEWDSGSVYSTTINVYNARDQLETSRVYQGTETSGIFHETTISYDGLGRIKNQHLPEQKADGNISGSTDHTSWQYNSDDTIQSVTDARGITTTFGYNARHLTTSISYPQNLPTGIPATSNVTYEYDEAGNRTSTSQGTANVATYHYDSLSRLVAEAWQFPGLSGTYTLAYEYNLAGHLKKVADQSPGVSTSFTYARDNAGRIASVNSVGLGASTPLVSNAEYRASGALKHSEFGNGTGMNLSYNGRALITQYSLTGVKESNGNARAEGSDFQHYADGRVKFATDHYGRSTGAISFHDKAYQYDHVARLKTALTGVEANDYLNGTNSAPSNNSPYLQTTTLDVWNNLVSRAGHYWGEDDILSTQTYDSHSRNSAWNYDADGRLLSMNEAPPNQLPFVPAEHIYDAAGHRIKTTQTTSRNMTLLPGNPVWTTVTTVDAVHDGDGKRIKQVSTQQTNASAPSTETRYYLRSTVLGQVVTEYDGQGMRQKSYVYSGGVLISSNAAGLKWRVNNPVTGDGRETDNQGKLLEAAYLDPNGVDVGFKDPADNQGEPPPPDPLPHAGAYAAYLPRILGGSGRCRLNGIEWGCGFIRHLADTRIVEPVPELAYSLRRWVKPSGINLRLPQNPFDQFVGPLAADDGVDIIRTGTALLNQGHWETISWSWLDPVLPQNSGFLIGRFGFPTSERERLGRAYDKITSDECRKFFNETLSRMRKNGEIHSEYQTTPTTLAGVLAITTLNRYSPNLTAAAVGISQNRWSKIQHNFKYGKDGRVYAGVTLSGDGRVFLGDWAFYQPNSFMQTIRKDGDLPGNIVHEFFHRAGLTEAQVKALNPYIQKYCGSIRDAL